jgi:hypothetical protein
MCDEYDHMFPGDAQECSVCSIALLHSFVPFVCLGCHSGCKLLEISLQSLEPYIWIAY